MAKKYVFYHDPCLDGFGSAYMHWIFNDRPSSDKIEYCGLTTSAKQKGYLNFDFDKYEKEKAHITFLDFAPNREDLIEFHERGNQVCVIDHHKTSIEMLHDLNKNFGVEPTSLILSENNEMSGVGLCFNLFKGLLNDQLKMVNFFDDWEYSPEKEEYDSIKNKIRNLNSIWLRAFQYVQDRDLWNWELRETAEICAALDSYEQDFKIWDEILFHSEVSLFNEGSSILRFKQKSIDKIKKSWYPISVGPYTAAALNSNVFQSELGNVLLNENVDLAVVYYDDKHGKKTCSLRSRNDFDCSKIAQFFGGGGHAQASGCQVNALEDLKKYGH